MFEKFQKMFGAGNKEKPPPVKHQQAQPVAPSDLGEAVAALDPDALPGSSEAIRVDTGMASSDGQVTNILPVETHGARTDASAFPLRFLGRQPVLDKTQRIIGYDLLLRNKVVRTPSKIDDSLAQMQDEMLLRSIHGLNIERLLGDNLAFIGLSAVMMDNPMLELLPRKGVVLVFKTAPEHVWWMVERMKHVASIGFQVALDDFFYAPELDPILPFAKYIRMDVTKFNAMQMGEQIVRIRKRGTPQFLANNVQTDEDFEACRELGFEQFEGYYFAKMQPALPPRLNSDRLRVMELLNLVTRHADIAELDLVFKRDATLSYRLLRYVNSPGCGLPQKLRSISHALVLLGHDQLYRWLTLLLFTAGKVDARSRALLKNAMVRARLTEVLGNKKLSDQDREGLFIVGIFSLLDVLLNMPMPEALTHLNLPEPIVRALVEHDGIYAPFLMLAVACEELDEIGIEQLANACGLTVEEVNMAHVEAMVWAEDVGK
jgi:EAL and modified HD-GYP domain-containing signal transduction protein